MRKAILVAVVCAFVAVPAMAEMTIQVNTSAGIGHPLIGGGVGGEFQAKVLDDAIGMYHTPQTFFTFCIERNENLNAPGQIYYVNVTGGATHGGLTGGDPDALDTQSAWIYSQWLDGGIAYDADHAKAVQAALWFLEGEIDDPTLQAQPYNGIANAIISAANAAVAGGWVNNDIAVMNLYQDAARTMYKQDLLVRVPVPGAVLLGLLGLSAAGLKLRRFA